MDCDKDMSRSMNMCFCWVLCQGWGQGVARGACPCRKSLLFLPQMLSLCLQIVLIKFHLVLCISVSVLTEIRRCNCVSGFWACDLSQTSLLGVSGLHKCLRSKDDLRL